MNLLHLKECRNHTELMEQIVLILRLSVTPRDDKQTQVTREVVKKMLKLLASASHSTKTDQKDKEPLENTFSKITKTSNPRKSKKVSLLPFVWFFFSLAISIDSGKSQHLSQLLQYK